MSLLSEPPCAASALLRFTDSPPRGHAVLWARSPYRFDQDRNEWIAQHQPQRHTDAQPRCISVLTWNVWHSSFQLEARIQAQLQILRQIRADVICLQEVCPQFVHALVDQSWVRREYVLSDVSGSTVTPYGVLMLARVPVREYCCQVLPSRQSRRLLTATLELHPFVPAIHVATVHLESLPHNSMRRLEQMRCAFKLLQGYETVILAGDLNFADSSAESAALPNEYTDTWMAVNEDERDNPGHTMRASGSFAAWRPDRILLKSADRVLQPRAAALVGGAPLAYEASVLTEIAGQDDLVEAPSDHSAVHTLFSILGPCPCEQSRSNTASMMSWWRG